MKSFYKAVRRVCAFLIGIVFFVAGVLKLMDPVGTGLVVTEYLKFLHLGFLVFGAKAAGVCLALLETLVGAALVTGVLRKTAGLLSGLMMLVFTVLTFVLWIVNPAMDCGCFGEAIHLTHLQSLLKNVVLDVLWIVAFLPFRELGVPKRMKKVSFAIAAVSVLLFAMYSLLSIPAVDYTPLAPGMELYGAASSPDDDPSWDISENLPATLSFCNAGWEYCDSLACEGPVLAVSVYEPGKVSGEGWKRISAVLDAAQDAGFTGLLLVASTPERMEETVPGTVLMRCFYADRKTLLTLNRSNGGATVVLDGQIGRKWAFRSLPSADDFLRLAKANPTEETMKYVSEGRIRLQAFLLYVTAVMVLL